MSSSLAMVLTVPDVERSRPDTDKWSTSSDSAQFIAGIFIDVMCRGIYGQQGHHGGHHQGKRRNAHRRRLIGADEGQRVFRVFSKRDLEAGKRRGGKAGLNGSCFSQATFLPGQIDDPCFVVEEHNAEKQEHSWNLFDNRME